MAQTTPSSFPVTVVVPTYLRPAGLRTVLQALSNQTLPFDKWEAVIVDDASPSAMARTIDELAACASFNVRVIHNEANLGPAAARNIGWRSSRAPILAFTDDDCTPLPAWLEAGLAALTSRPEIGVLQGRTTRPDGHESYRYTAFTVARDVPAPTPWFEGCNLFFRREALEAGGGFDESIGYFGEETSLGWRALEAGWKRGFAADAVVEHALEERPWSWHLKIRFLEGHLVKLAKEHPEMRSMLWRPWAVRREDALFALALAALPAALWRRSALVGTLPYLAWLRWHISWLVPRFRPGLRPAAYQTSFQAAALAGKLIASAKERTLLL